MQRSVLQSEKYKAYLAFSCVAFFWGTTYLALRVGVKYVPPFFFSGLRQVTAGLIILSWFALKKHSFPDKKELFIHLICGILMITLGNGMVAWAELYISSGLAALICSLVPVWIILINLLIKSSEKLNLKIAMGSFLAISGLFMIFGDNLKDFANQNYLKGILAIVVANICWAIGTVINKNSENKANPILAAGLQVFSGGVFMLIYSLISENFSHLNFNLEAVTALIYLIFFGTILAFGAYIYSLSKLPTIVVSLTSYINPLIAILLGYIILDEKLNWVIGIAFVVTISGVFLVNRGSIKNE